MAGLVEFLEMLDQTYHVPCRKHAEPQRLFACTDCGLVLRSRAAAAGKMRALAACAAIVNRELGAIPA
jgi:methionine synthase II (cobalamin-independent)